MFKVLIRFKILQKIVKQWVVETSQLQVDVDLVVKFYFRTNCEGLQAE
jgi:hypothetical protein